MMVLRGNTTEQAALLASAGNGTQVISMVAFRSVRQIFNSVAVSLRCEDPAELDADVLGKP